MRTTITLSFLGLMALVSPVGGQTLTDDQIAQEFVPPAFTTFAAENPGLSTEVSWTTLGVPLDGPGGPRYVAIAYGNAHIGLLRLVRGSSAPVLVGETTSAVSCDAGPRISAVDLDGDGLPELAMECSNGNRGTPFTSFFKWTATGLRVLNPPHPRRSNSWWPIASANAVDLDGSGVMAILEPNEPPDTSEHAWYVYRLLDGHLVKSSTMAPVFFERFYRAEASPNPEQQSFTATPGVYRLLVINGSGGGNMVSSATISVNGSLVVSPSMFSQNARRLAVDVTLTSANSISVALRSAPGAFVDLVITPKN